MVRLKEFLPTDTTPCPLYFNSSMVRLKVTLLALCQHPQLNFNSSMVRLKELPETMENNSKSYFNSSMVRLKDKDLRHDPASETFQFLYGSIKRRMNILRKMPYLNFNSSMVRLKAVPKKSDD